MPSEFMALRQVNFRLPLIIKRLCMRAAESDGKTLEGWLQDAITATLDQRLDEIEAEAQALADWVGDARMRERYANGGNGGMDR